MKSNKISLEKVSLATLFSVTLSPIILSLLHYPFVWLLGGNGDSYQLIFGSLVIAFTAGIAYYLHSEKIMLFRVSIVSIISILLSIGLGIGIKSQVTIFFIFFSLGLILSFLIAWLAQELPIEIDGMVKKYKIRTILFLLLAIFSITQTARLSVFINDSKYTEASLLPHMPFFVTHSCLTAYTHAAELMKEGNESLYNPKNWPENSTKEYPPFGLDLFMYPPPFLLLPTALFSITDSFQEKRAIWFGFCGLLISFAFWIAAKWTSAKQESHGIFLIFLVWSSLAVLTTLQVGNVQHVVMAMSLLGMLAFERNRPLVGGALLAFSIASKISPGLLVVILLVQRRWRDLTWTAFFGIFFTVLSILFFGVKPLLDFITYQLPLLSSGKAMPWLDKESINILMNVGPFSIPFKLGLLGVEFNNPWRIAKIISTVYIVLALIAVVFSSRQNKNLRQKVCLWLGVLTLSGLQSPFAPGYVLITLLWAMTILAAEIKNKNELILFITVWILLTIPLLPIVPVHYLAIASLFQQLIGFVAIAIILTFKSNSLVS